jgi:outer membrane immunogenic protein
MLRTGLFLLSAAFTTVGAVSSFAADLPLGSDAPYFSPTSMYDWSGFYVGGNAGVSAANSGHVTISDPVLGAQSISVANRSGLIGGVQVGSNLQFGSFVYGIEADFQYANVGTSINWGPYGRLGLGANSSAGYFGTVRGRAGYAIDRTLLYLTGGLAYGGLNKSPLGGNSTSDIGYAFGGGVEYAFTQNWTVKAEALYVGLANGRNQQFVVVNNAVSYPISVRAGNGGVLARVGVNYKF